MWVELPEYAEYLTQKQEVETAKLMYEQTKARLQAAQEAVQVLEKELVEAQGALTDAEEERGKRYDRACQAALRAYEAQRPKA